MSVLPILPDRAVIRLTGGDVRTFLQGVITQDIDRLSPEAAVFSALLTPQGKILFDFFLVENGDAVFVDCYKDAAADLVKRLTLYRMRADVTIALEEDLAIAASDEPMAQPDAIEFRDPRTDALGNRAIVKKENNAEDQSYRKRRIEFGVPEFGSDFGADDVFLLDVNYDALNAVSYAKGCFVGQEVTSRMKRKSDVRKRTLTTTSNNGDLETGAPIKAGESTLGEIFTTSGNAGLAIIRLDRLEAAKARGDTPESNGAALTLNLPDYLNQQ